MQKYSSWEFECQYSDIAMMTVQIRLNNSSMLFIYLMISSKNNWNSRKKPFDPIKKNRTFFGFPSVQPGIESLNGSVEKKHRE